MIIAREGFAVNLDHVEGLYINGLKIFAQSTTPDSDWLLATLKSKEEVEEVYYFLLDKWAKRETRLFYIDRYLEARQNEIPEHGNSGSAESHSSRSGEVGIAG